jgi:MraZ protein
MLPSDWRAEGGPKEFTMLIWPVTTREYLLVLPPARWERVQQNVAAQSLADEGAAEVGRWIARSAFETTQDRFGRLHIPEAAAQVVGIEDEAVLVGNIDKFELWQPARFKAALARPEAQWVADKLKTMMI